MRATLWTCGLVVALAAPVGIGRLVADDEDDKPAEPQTRIACLNLTRVIRDYTKFRNLQEEIRDVAAPFQQRDAALQRKMAKLREEAQELMQHANDSEKTAAQLPKKKEQLEARAKKIQRDQEDLRAEVQQKLNKRSDELMREVFLDVARVVERHALQHDLDLVLHYNDAIGRSELFSSKNIARKMNDGALELMTTAPGIDISKEITDQLNREYRNKS